MARHLHIRLVAPKQIEHFRKTRLIETVLCPDAAEMVAHQLDRPFQQERIQGCHQTSAGLDLQMRSKPPCGLSRLRTLFARYDRIVLAPGFQNNAHAANPRSEYNTS